jgi:pSer/pThr/pTyr-binding forkhead associated (FHA) protein
VILSYPYKTAKSLLFRESERLITVRDGRGMGTIRRDGIKMRKDIRIGRWSGCGIRMDEDDRTASRHHARVLSEGGEYFIEDICSASGTFVDGEKIDRKRKLEDGAEIRIGKALMQFRSGGMEGKAYGTFVEG